VLDDLPVPVPIPLQTQRLAHHKFANFLPKPLVLIVLMLVRKCGMPSRVHSVELFAGCHSVSNGVKTFGYAAAPWPVHNMCIRLCSMYMHNAARLVWFANLFMGPRTCVPWCEVSLDFNSVSPYDDMSTSSGFLRALLYVIGLEPGIHCKQLVLNAYRW
jgi:hypothetical protein